MRLGLRLATAFAEVILGDLETSHSNLDLLMKLRHNRSHLAPVLALLLLAGCGDKPSQPAAAAPPPVTIAQPTKRTVTDWDEFTGRFEAVEEVQVRARVGGFVTSVEFRDGAIVHAGDLLYVIDSVRSRRSRCRPMDNCRTRAPRPNWPSANSIVR